MVCTEWNAENISKFDGSFAKVLRVGYHGLANRGPKVDRETSCWPMRAYVAFEWQAKFHGGIRHLCAGCCGFGQQRICERN